MSRIKYKDLTGQRFGRLTVICRSEKSNGGKVYWHCKCDCGNERDVVTYSLVHGKTQSCGCLSREQARTRYRDVSGEKFGRLTAIEPTDKRRSNAVVWRCKCDCGNEKMVAIDDLISGATTSCGCLMKGKPRGNPKVMHEKIAGERFKGSNTLNASLDKKINSNNKSGVMGVFWHRGKWVARIRFKGKDYYLGQYDNIEDAAKARRDAEIRLFGNYQIEVGEIKGEVTKGDIMTVLNWLMEHGFGHYDVAELLNKL